MPLYSSATGASPWSSIKNAGSPWELGLAEAQQVLLLNGLRDRIVVQTDGQLKTGRDVVIAALLGAEEFGFASAPLVVSGCIMMRVCHLDTCPVGVATQNPELRKKYSGKPEFVVNFFEFIAEEVRELLAELGFRSIADAIGHAEYLDTDAAVAHWKTAGLDLSPILHVPAFDEATQDRHCTKSQDHGLDRSLDVRLIEAAAPALERGEVLALRAEGEGVVLAELDPARIASVRAASLRGSSTTMSPRIPSESSRNFGSCVDFPEPVGACRMSRLSAPSASTTASSSS